jgi:hypothetical protein
VQNEDSMNHAPNQELDNNMANQDSSNVSNQNLYNEAVELTASIHPYLLRNTTTQQLNNPHQKQPDKFETEMKNLQRFSCNSCGRSYLSTKEKTCIAKCSNFTGLNDMDPGTVPPELSDLTYLEEQLIARIHPVISVYRIRGHQIGYRGQVINFPQDVKVFASSLPHRIMDLTSVLAVRFKNQKEGTETFIDFHVRAKKVRDALTWLKINNPYYHDISISDENLALLPDNGDMSASILSIFEDDDGHMFPETDNVDQNEQVCKMLH